MIMRRMINNNIIFLITKKMKKLYCVIFGIENLKNLKYHTSLKTLVLSINCSKSKNEEEKIFQKEESIEILKFFV